LLLLTFNRRIDLEQTISEPSGIAPLLEGPTDGGLTALYDSLYSTCKHEIFSRDGDPHRSAVILLSDGEDDISMHGLNDAIDQAELNGIAIYTITMHDPRSVDPGDGVLHSMAAATGGRDFVVKDASQLELALAMINQELRSSYLLYYRASDESGPRNFRRVYILPTQHDGSQLRSRMGYYTKP
jgi:VWFA-related protein